MNAPVHLYPHLLALAEHGYFPVVAIGTRAGRPSLTWCAIELDAEGEAWAGHPSRNVKAAQGLGAVITVAENARRYGFTPA